MDENSGNQSQPAPVNQTPQGVITPPTSNVVQPTRTNPTSFQQPTTYHQIETVQPAVEKKTKSGKKVILIVFGVLILLVVLIVVGLFVILTPTVKGLSACMEENKKHMDTLFQKGLAEKWTNQQKCQEFKPETEKLIACYERVGGAGLLSEQLAFTIEGVIRGKEMRLIKRV